MPKVRYSSGAIGTKRLPMPLSRMRSLSTRTNAMVVAMVWLPEPFLTALYASSPGSSSCLGRTLRVGT